MKVAKVALNPMTMGLVVNPAATCPIPKPASSTADPRLPKRSYISLVSSKFTNKESVD
jgi:hypothetical protein